MQIDLEQELRRTEEDMSIAASSLRDAGFTEEQMEQLGRYVHAAIAHNHYAILKAGREVRAEATAQDFKSESAFQPGAFQTKVVR